MKSSKVNLYRINSNNQDCKFYHRTNSSHKNVGRKFIFTDLIRLRVSWLHVSWNFFDYPWNMKYGASKTRPSPSPPLSPSQKWLIFMKVALMNAFGLNSPNQLVIRYHWLAFLNQVRNESKTQSSKSQILESWVQYRPYFKN